MRGELGYSPRAKISTLAAYEQARRALRGICEPIVAPMRNNCARSRRFGGDKKCTPQMRGAFFMCLATEIDDMPKT